MPTSGKRGSLLIVTAAILWGTTGTAQAVGPDSAPIAVGAVRMVIGGAALVLVAAILRRLPRHSWRSGTVVLAGAAMAAYQPLFFAGVLRTGVAVGTVVAIGSAPVLAGVLAFMVRGDPLRWKWIAATAVAILGLVLLVSAGTTAGVEIAGVALALGAGVCYAIYAVAAKPVVSEHSPLTAMSAIFGWAAALSIPLLAVSDVSWLSDDSGWFMALYLGLITTALAYLLFARGLAVTPVGTAATLTLAEPATAAILAVLVLDEMLGTVSIVGLLLITGALLLLSRSEADAAYRSV